MAEMRMDPTTMTWVITGEERGSVITQSDAGCPFCPGNEDKTQPTIYEVREGDHWKVRVFPDKNPIFRIEYSEDREADGIYDKMKNRGAHEIIVNHPSHNSSFLTMGIGGIACALDVYAKRIEDLKKDGHIKHIFLFENQGELTGSMIRHSHSHLVATPIIPKRIEQELKWANYHYRKKERCLFCDIIRQEMRQGVRVAFENKGFVALCPFASRFPYEVWILPKTHSHAFERTMEDEGNRLMLGELIREILSRVEAITPHYHMVLHNSPNENAVFVNGEGKTLREDFHWHFEILPLLKGMKRFMWEEEFFINPVRPEDAAILLRKMGWHLDRATDS